MSFECISVVGFAGDRTAQAMMECHGFAMAFSEYFDFPCELVGGPESPRNLPWDAALLESKQTFESIVKNLSRILDSEHKPVLFTPRCASAIASLPTIVTKHPNVIVLYFDAHGDVHTPETSDSSYLGGMPLAAVLGKWDSGYGAGLESSNLVHIGGRDFDSAENAFIKQSNLLSIAKNDIESDLTHLRSLITGKPVFIHLDTDVFDPSEVIAEYAVDHGLYRHHVRKIVDIVLERSELVGIEITELSPHNYSERLHSYTAIFESFHGIRDSN